MNYNYKFQFYITLPLKMWNLRHINIVRSSTANLGCVFRNPSHIIARKSFVVKTMVFSL
jgi:hypothetical protein